MMIDRSGVTLSLRKTVDTIKAIRIHQNGAPKVLGWEDAVQPPTR